ncbi:hypothetical protein pqer_cds_712 [Pandoravirus quercus]|uniref:Uncharacterized protein n=1 Tax=Pandoravirus quercus TaxID=2107709 RepID=A0A2U7U9M5_9VIRU|nr:hypothetical protein pqer_cds_712 [Pandoravirus quercus]AVK75134.1 hypothetical protein pqer_cds_712 [Pandoravirus quercus]
MRRTPFTLVSHRAVLTGAVSTTRTSARTATRLVLQPLQSQKPSSARTLYSRSGRFTPWQSRTTESKIACVCVAATGVGAVGGGLLGALVGFMDRHNQGFTGFRVYYSAAIGAGCIGLPIAAVGSIAACGPFGIPAAFICALAAMGFFDLARMAWRYASRLCANRPVDTSSSS